MYELSIHNVTKLHLKNVNLFKGFSARTLTITSTDHKGIETKHDIKLFGEGHKNLMPITEEEVSYAFKRDEENSDVTEPTAA